ncbi:MAG: peroxiredoxin [Adhaeribacter sp.]|nr:peroxiredoxin [Adhaeribacter sp.]
MNAHHVYKITVKWNGNKGEGTLNYGAYERSHTISTDHKSDITGSSDPAFRGDKTKHNPEELLVSSILACHMLWYLHLCSEAGVIVTDFSDNATGTMVESANGSGYFTEVTLNPVIIVKDVSMIAKAIALHKTANERCFIANSVKFPIYHNPTCKALYQ